MESSRFLNCPCEPNEHEHDNEFHCGLEYGSVVFYIFGLSESKRVYRQSPNQIDGLQRFGCYWACTMFVGYVCCILCNNRKLSEAE